MQINGIETDAQEFAYDGCHKIYLIEDEKDKADAISIGYEILPITELKKTYKNSCSLKFIKNWKLNKRFVEQFEKAVFKK